MHRVPVVKLQAADRAIMANFRGPEEDLDQSKEKRHAADHDDDCNQPASGAGQRDISETGGRQRRDGEVERVDIVRDSRIGPMPSVPPGTGTSPLMPH